MTSGPPDRVRLLWCPACGQGDRLSYMSPEGGRHYAGGLKCPGGPVKLEYRLPEQPQFIAGTASLRAKLEMTVTVWPELPHLTEGPAIVGQAHLVSGDTAEHLAAMIEAFGSLVVQQVADRLAVHPRPAPPGWGEELHEPREWLHEYGA